MLAKSCIMMVAVVSVDDLAYFHRFGLMALASRIFWGNVAHQCGMVAYHAECHG